MKKSLCFSFILLISLLAGNSYGHFTEKGHVHTLSKTEQLFLNPDCRSTDTCDLKRFTLTTSVYAARKPESPVVYMADYPTGAFVTGNRVKNAALEFKTCIYKASDVPAETRRDDIDFAKPITCFEWQSVYVYDFDKGAFQANWADVPRPEEPYMRVKVYLLVIFITLFIALAVVTFSRLGNFLSQKIATNQTYSLFPFPITRK